MGRPDLRRVGTKFRQGLGPLPPHRSSTQVAPRSTHDPTLRPEGEGNGAQAEHSPVGGFSTGVKKRPLHGGLSAGHVELAHTPWQGATPRRSARTPPVGASLREWLENHTHSSPETSQGTNKRTRPTRLAWRRASRTPVRPGIGRPPLTAPAAGEEGQEPGGEKH